MYNKEVLDRLIDFIAENDGVGDKAKLAQRVQEEFGLVKDRKIFYCDWFGIVFCQSKKNSNRFSNVVLSLSKLQKYDARPVIACLVTPEENYLFLCNTTFLNKISHSSQKLTEQCIRGSFLGSNIIRNFAGKENEPENFEYLFTTHENFTFEENLTRLVEATHDIVPRGKKFVPSEEEYACIRASVQRAKDFLDSKEYQILEADLENRVHKVETEIAIAAFIDNVNLRGRIIEYLITEEDTLKENLMRCLRERKPLPPIYTSDDLGDYEYRFPQYWTETDIKTKILFLGSNPKGYNVDKLLKFLAQEKTVYLIYIIAIGENGNLKTKLCSMYNRQLMEGTTVIDHWAGRNSRGAAQYEGKALESIVNDFEKEIDETKASQFLEELIGID